MRQNRRSLERVADLPRTAGPAPWTSAQLRSLGWTMDALQAAVSGGRLIRLRRGVYGLGEQDAFTPIRTALAVVPHGVVSHESAGRVQGLWLPVDARDGVHLTDAGAADRTEDGLTVHGSRLPRQFVTEVDGMPITTIPRTAVDLARGRSFAEALVVVDSATRALSLRDGRRDEDLRNRTQRQEASREALHLLGEAFSSVWTWPGTAVVRAAIAAADVGSESAHESRSRAWLLEAKLPTPLIGFEVYGASGRRYFSDFAWPERKLLGEADGFGKYFRTGDDRALRDERKRQADLEDAGWRFVRWTTSDWRAAVVARVRRALDTE